jgi:hypothetical protein
MRLIARLLILLLLLGGDPLGMLTVSAVNAAASAEDDEAIETGKLAVQADQVNQHRPRPLGRPIVIPLTHQFRTPIPAARRFLSAATVFLVAVNSPLNC